MTAGVLLSLLAGGLAVLLARENKLRRGLQALCSRLLARLAETTGQHFTQPTAGPRGRPRRR
jgi:hypothetical protein